jgi:hypothetical protein
MELTMSTLVKLIEGALEKRWCTRLYCTTCGALDFRRELSKQSKTEILDDLRKLPQEFCERYADVLRLIFVEIAVFPTCFDLIEPLENTPAGEVLQSAISHARYMAEKQREHEIWCSPEAAKERATVRKRENELAHRLRISKKVESDKRLDVFRNAIQRSDFNSFFMALAEVKDPATARAVGGFAYKTLRELLRVGKLSEAETALLEKYASNFGGYWLKLIRGGSRQKRL